MLFSILNENNLHYMLVNMNGNLLNDDCMEVLRIYLQNNDEIEFILIGNNKITDKGIEILLPGIIKSINLNSIDISYNVGITDKSIQFLNDIVSRKVNICEVRIHGTLISEQKLLVIQLISNILMKKRFNHLIFLASKLYSGILL